MSTLQGVSHVIISGGTHVATGAGSTVTVNQGTHPGVNSGIAALKDLSAVAAHAALHDSAARFDAPRCHRNTRAKHLDKLELWMLGKEGHYAGKRLIWLNGGAGVGKSAIMQSVVERCIRNAVILGTFFFSRADPSRNYAESLVPTLAYQLARAFPATIAILEPVIHCDPLIFKASLHKQAYELLVRPILHLVDTGVMETSFCRTFVIDGLDECSDPKKQEHIIQAVASILCDYHLPISFLIASRTEVSINYAFQRENRLHNIFSSICLDTDVDAEFEIRQFIMDSFLDILNSHPLRHHIILPWPASQSIDRLMWKSSGNFIYAATAMKFIASSDEHPVRALKVVEGLQPSRTEGPFTQLDALYFHILTSAKFRSQVLGILRHCIMSGFERSVAAVCRIHDTSPEDIELFLSDVQSLACLSPSGTAELYINLKHASLGDFLMDKKRSLALYITEQDYHASFLGRYFQLLDDGPQLPTSSFYFGQGGAFSLILNLAQAIVHSRDANLLHSLIAGHAPRDIWNFCVKACAADTTMPSRNVRAFTIGSVCRYVGAIRDSDVLRDDNLYTHQFTMCIQLILDDLDDLAHRKPQYRIIPAFIFSSSPTALALARNLLLHFGHRFRIDASYRYHYEPLQGDTFGVTDPRSFEAIRSFPQSRVSWGSDLAIAMVLVLRQLVDPSGLWKPERLYPNPHRQWLQKRKPLKQISLGSPRLSSRPNPNNKTVALKQHGCSGDRARKIWNRRKKCHIILKAIVFYLHKSDSTRDLANLARKCLPKAALWYPKLMDMARAAMDAYVDRWEESTGGLLERAELLSINGID